MRATARAAALLATSLVSAGGASVGVAAASQRPATGIASLPAAQILARSAGALAQQTNLVVVGNLQLGGEAIAFAVRSNDRGKNVAGTVTIHTGAKSVVGPVSFIDLPQVLYLKAGAPFWDKELSTVTPKPSATQIAAAVSKLANRWIELTGSQTSAFSSGFGGLTEPGKFAQSLLKGNGTLTKHATATVRGRSVVPISTSTGATIDIAATGTPIPVEIVGGATVASTKVHIVALISAPQSLVVQAPRGAETLASLEASLG